MPLALDPSQTFPIWLDSDADKKPRPEFHFRALTIRDRQRVHSLPEQFKANDSITADEIVDQSMDLFSDLCSGWSNMIGRDGQPIVFSRDSVLDVLTHQELWELMNQAAYNSHVSHAEKKSSES